MIVARRGEGDGDEKGDDAKSPKDLKTFWDPNPNDMLSPIQSTATEEVVDG